MKYFGRKTQTNSLFKEHQTDDTVVLQPRVLKRERTGSGLGLDFFGETLRFKKHVNTFLLAKTRVRATRFVGRVAFGRKNVKTKKIDIKTRKNTTIQAYRGSRNTEIYCTRIFSR